MKYFYVAVLALGLAGCSHSLSLMERSGPLTGHGSATGMGNSGSLTVNLAGKDYSGKWVLVQGGGFGLLNSYGAHPSTGSALMVDGNGDGNALLKSADGSGLRCEFRYGSMSGTGLGVCQDDAGKIYDMQIN